MQLIITLQIVTAQKTNAFESFQNQANMLQIYINRTKRLTRCIVVQQAQGGFLHWTLPLRKARE